MRIIEALYVLMLLYHISGCTCTCHINIEETNVNDDQHQPHPEDENDNVYDSTTPQCAAEVPEDSISDASYVTSLEDITNQYDQDQSLGSETTRVQDQINADSQCGSEVLDCSKQDKQSDDLSSVGYMKDEISNACDSNNNCLVQNEMTINDDKMNDTCAPTGDPAVLKSDESEANNVITLTSKQDSIGGRRIMKAVRRLKPSQSPNSTLSRVPGVLLGSPSKTPGTLDSQVSDDSLPSSSVTGSEPHSDDEDSTPEEDNLFDDLYEAIKLLQRAKKKPGLKFADIEYLHDQFAWGLHHRYQLLEIPMLPNTGRRVTTWNRVDIEVAYDSVIESLSCHADDTLLDSLEYIEDDILYMFRRNDPELVFISQFNFLHYRLPSSIKMRNLRASFPPGAPLEITVLLYLRDINSVRIHHWAKTN